MSDPSEREPEHRPRGGKQDESDLASDRCPDCGALSLEARAPAADLVAPAKSKARVSVPTGHSLTCENCGRMWTRKR